MNANNNNNNNQNKKQQQQQVHRPIYLSFNNHLTWTIRSKFVYIYKSKPDVFHFFVIRYCWPQCGWLVGRLIFFLVAFEFQFEILYSRARAIFGHLVS